MDKYQRVKVLGKGSFGSAILIKRKTDGLLFVVKEVGMMRMSKKERDEARHECTVLQQLQHPNIVRYVEQFENNNNLYIVMEYCDGGDLAEKVKQSRGPMKESSMLYYFSQICLAMEYLHARHILHRDIKTMNVFLMKNGAVKLGDFGISTVLRTTMGMANTVCGTPYYFSPELCRNRPYNNKSDIWALGVLLYECATGGRHPFDGTSMNQLMQRIVQGHYVPLSSQYSSDFRKMVDWCLQKDPAKRPSIKQTLALPLMRSSLEQLEENLMLATQCRVRLKDIIDFESAMDQEERKGNSPQPSPKPSPHVVAKDGVSPGQAAALAMAHHRISPPSQQPSQPPMPSPGCGGTPAVVGPKPSAPVQRSPSASPRQDNGLHYFYSPYLKKPIVSPLLPGGGARPAPADAPNGVIPPPPAPRPLEEPHHIPPMRNNVNLGGGGAEDRQGLEAGGAPAAVTPGPSPNAADVFHADMRRVDAIIARYGRNTDEKAKETIHAYMRRKHEAYLKRQKEELEVRERRNKMRKDELRRVLENQRMAATPLHNNDHRSSPQLNNMNANGYADDRSPRRGAPQSRAKPENLQRPSRSPPSSPSQAKEFVLAHTPTSAEAPVFGRDPRRGAPPGEPVSRPTTPQRQCLPPQTRSSVPAFPHGDPVARKPLRRVLCAANSPQQVLPVQQRRSETKEARRAVTPGPLRTPSARLGIPRGAAIDIDCRSSANSKPEPPYRGRKAPLSAGLGGGIDGHRMMLQPSQQQPPQPRRHTEEEQLLAPRDRREQRALDDAVVARRPSALYPISGDARGHRTPCQAAQPQPLNERELLSKGVPGAAAAERAPPSVGGNPRLQRPSRALQGYLKPLNGRGEDGLSPLTSPISGQSPREGAAGAEHGHRGSSGVSPSARPKQLPSAGNANLPSAVQLELVDIPRAAAPSPKTPVNSSALVGETLRALRRHKMQGGAPAPPSPSVVAAEVKDLPALNFASPELERGVRRSQHRYHSEEAAVRRGMMREQASRDDERFLTDEYRKQHHSEESAVPNTLEVLRNLRMQQDQAMEAEGGAREEANPGGQLALLKQRQRMQHRPRQSSASSCASVALTPPLMTRAAEAVSPPKSEALSFHDRKARGSRDKAAARPSAAHVTALSLGGVNRIAAPSQAALPSAYVGAPPSPKPSTGGGGGVQSSMDGYAEMLQHLKDLLQRRRCSRAGGGSAPISPNTADSAQPAMHRQGDPVARSPVPIQKRELPPPLNPMPFDGDVISGTNGSDDAGVLLSPPHLKETRPLHPQRASLPALKIRLSGNAEEEDEEEDDDFEDAVPLSPVRCAELNDAYARQQDQQPQKSHRASEDVYTNVVDLTSATMEEELEGEEGYTGYDKLPYSNELLKGLQS